jgi:hypothetical protein
MQTKRFQLFFGAALLLMAAGTLGAQSSSGYKVTDAVAFSYQNIAGTGIAVLAGADDGTAVINTPFPFLFFGTSYTSLCVSTNGLIAFGSCVPNDFNNLDLTSQGPPGNQPLIAPFWTDLTFAAPGAGSVVYQTLGAAGSRQFVIQWNNAMALNAPGALNFQAILLEGSNDIVFQYQSVESSDPAVNKGAGATVGIRGMNGQSTGNRLQWSYRAPVLKNGQAIRFIADSVAPLITGMPAPGCQLWPPNNKLVKVATVTATDTGSGMASLNVTGTSNEPPSGAEPDIVITGTGWQRIVQLRAKRLGTGTDRIYTLTAVATDLAGNTARVSSTCTVPHDQGK